MYKIEIILVWWLIILSWSLFAVYRIYKQFWCFATDYYLEENTSWSTKFNPHKIKIYLFLFSVFLLPFFFHKSFMKTTGSWDSFSFLIVITQIISVAHYLLELKIKSKTKNYVQNMSETNQFVQVFNELKPSSLGTKEIKKKFDYALTNNYFDCNFQVFEDFLNLKNPVEKIIWKPISGRKKMKHRKLLLNFVDDLFQNKLITIERKEVCQLVNKYFEFNELGHKINENPLSTDNVNKWIYTQ